MSSIASSLLAPRGSLRGSQQPRIASYPPYGSSAGAEVIKVARLAGIELDEWQQRELTHGMGESPDWKCPKCVHRSVDWVPCPRHPDLDLIHPWAAFEVAEIVPRQNGKSELLIARMLGGLFVLEEPLQIYSAHLFDTAMEVMRRLVFVIENTDELRAEVKHRGSRMVGIKYSHGEEGVELQSGLRVRFKARTGGGGRGFSCDCLYLDEAMILPESFLGATVPTLSAMPNPQIWLAGSAPDQYEPTHDGIVLAKRRERALAGGDESLAYFEHSAEGDSPDAVGDDVLDDPAQWALANPGLGIRITVEYVANERRAMGARQFAVERLGIGDWPETDSDNAQIIPVDAWDALKERGAEILGRRCFVFDVSPNNRSAAVAVGGRCEDGSERVEVVAHKDGTGWLEDFLVDLAESDDVEMACDGRGPAAEFIGKLKNRGVKVTSLDAQEHAQSCVSLLSAVEAGSFSHDGAPEVSEALRGAAVRPLLDSWAWARKTSSVDISPLVAVTLARRKAELMRSERESEFGWL